MLPPLSKHGPPDQLNSVARSWGSFLCWIAASSAITLSIAFVVLIASDPYGRLGIRRSHQIAAQPERLLAVTRALDPQFNSAVIGNSTAIPLNPEFLGHLVDGSFVNLVMSGSGPKAQIAMLRFFLAHHSDARFIVIGLDDTWCTSQQLGEQREFPFWLYSDLPSYLVGMARNMTLRLLLSPFEGRDNGRLDGWQSYPVANNRQYDDIAWVANSLRRPRPTSPWDVTRLPGMDEIASLILHSPRSISFVLLWTPRYINLIPAPGSGAEHSDRVCKEKLTDVLTSVANARIIDGSEDTRADNSDPANFYDYIHYRKPLGERLMLEIATSLKAISGGN